jgi:hypothetical protein
LKDGAITLFSCFLQSNAIDVELLVELLPKVMEAANHDIPLIKFVFQSSSCYRLLTNTKGYNRMVHESNWILLSICSRLGACFKVFLGWHKIG